MDQLEIDRTKICPFLLRLLWKENSSHELEEFNEVPSTESGHEIHIYTWVNATLKELYNAVKTSIPVANRKDAKIHFYHVYQDTSGRFKKKSITSIHSLKRSKNDNLTLRSFRFEIGDIIEINIQTSKQIQR